MARCLDAVTHREKERYQTKGQLRVKTGSRDAPSFASALPQKADVCGSSSHVSYGPFPDIGISQRTVDFRSFKSL